ncbi:MAG TPA: phosphatidylglycerophosphatase A [Candidatus Acidoferrum sp.]|nr:phosphatidylglycerophosphatase A [Candidatus Acidoferrum sp.]
MTTNPSPARTLDTSAEKPRLALAIATVFGIGNIGKAPGTLGSLAGVATAFLSAIFFLHPRSVRDLFSLHPLAETILRENLFGAPGTNVHNSTLGFPLVITGVVFLLLSALGVWSASRVASYEHAEDPQHVVIDEVAGQHLTLLLPLVPIALPHLMTHFDFSEYTIFFALSLANWKYLVLGFILFRVFDIWKPWPIRRLEKLRGGWGIMADDWMAGVFAAILLRVALYFGLLTIHIGWV